MKVIYDERGMKRYVKWKIEWDLIGMALVTAALAITVVLAIIYRVPM